MAERVELVGREPELAVLDECCEAAVAGSPRLVICIGEPGIGKTRLAEELLARAARKGVLAVWGVGVDAAGAPPYWPWRQVLQGIGDRFDLAAIAEEQRRNADLVAVTTDLLSGGSEPACGGASADERFRQFDAVAMLLRHVTRRDPLLIVLDDAHAADAASMLLLQHIARGLRDERLLLLVNCRDTEPGHGAVLAELLREPGTRQLHLGGLDLQAVARQLTSVLGHDLDVADVARVQARTGGNPLFVAEVGRALAGGGAAWPASWLTWNVRAAIAARLSRLSEGAGRVLQAGSVVGREFPVAVVAAIVGMPVMRCVGLLDEAAQAGLVECPSTTGEHRFTHDLVREAVEAGLATPERVRLHRLAAEALERLYGNRLGPRLFDVARHWAVAAVAGERTRAVSWVERAGQEAMRSHAYEDGARLFRLALDVGAGELDEASRCRLLLELAPALHLTADLVGGLAACQQAAAVAEEIGRPDLVAEAALATEPTFFVREADLVIRQLCEQAIRLLEATPALRARVLARLAEACMALGDDHTARSASGQALILAEECGEQAALVAALKARQEVCSGPESLEERADLAERMLAVAGQPASPAVELYGHLARVDAALERGDLSLVAREIDEVARCAQQVPGRMARWLLLRSQSVLAQAQARFPDARRLAVEAFRTIEPLGHPTAPVVWSGFLSTTAHHVGHDAESLASSGLADGTGVQLQFPTAGVIRALAPAAVLAEVGRVQEAANIYRSLGPVDEWRPTPHATLFTYAFGINLAIALGASDDVAALHARLASYRGHHVVSGVCSIAYFGPVELWLGVAAAHLELLDDAVADLEHAAKACAVSGAAGFHAEAQLELAHVLDRRGGPGDHSRARRLAAAAARQAADLGMPPIATKANQLIDRLDLAGQALPLTPREREVAELVAQGLTNRQIAARLFLSERTAQNHVQHILDKLDVPNRSQIAVLVANGK